jgi:hypothetical protein
MVGTIICEVDIIICDISIIMCDIGIINVRFYLLEVQYLHGYYRITPKSKKHVEHFRTRVRYDT